MSDTKAISFADVQAHKEREDLYLLIHNKVYACTKFLDEHPGGDEVMLAEAGKDATEAFEDVGHSDEAREVLKTLYIGDLDGADEKRVKEIAKATHKVTTGSSNTSSPVAFLVPVAFIGGYLAWRSYYAP